MSLNRNRKRHAAMRDRAKFRHKYGDGPFRCAYCNALLSFDEVTIDHLAPISRALRSVSGHPDNLVASCIRCNEIKKAKYLREVVIPFSQYLRAVLRHFRYCHDGANPTPAEMVEWIERDARRPRGFGILMTEEFLRREVSAIGVQP